MPVQAAEKIQFSTSSTTPTLVKPGRKIDDLLEGTAERGGAKTDVPVLPDAPASPILPNKAQLDKMSELLDRKKNWLVPGAMDGPSAADAFGKRDASGKGLGETDKKESVMERYMRDGNGKKTDDASMSREDRDRDRRMKGLDNGRDNSRDGNDRNDDNYDPSRKDQNGLAAFDLAGFLSRIQSGHQPELIKDAEALRGFQPKSDFSPTQEFRSDRDRDQAREREAARSAEFMQLIRPRGGGVGLSDPLNSPDRTGREMNPIAVRGYEPLSRSSFGSPAASAPRAQDSMFGVATPAAALPVVTADPPPVISAPSYRPSQSILIAPPAKRLGD